MKYLSLAGIFLSGWWLALKVRIPVRPAGRTGGSDGRGKPAIRRPRQKLLAVAGACAGWLLAWDVPGLAWLSALALGGLGYYVVPLRERWRRRRRQLTLRRQLPDALELIANSMRAGLSLVQALETAARELTPPLADEIEETLRDIRLGLSAEDALEKWLLRWRDPDLELFVIAATVSRRTGGNLPEVAARLVDTIRERQRLQGRIDALTAQGRLSGWVIGALPVVLLIGMSFLDPDMMGDFYRHPVGWALLAAAAVMEAVGAFVITRLVAIDV